MLKYISIAILLFLSAEFVGQIGYYLVKDVWLYDNQIRSKGLTVLNEHGSVTYRPDHIKPHKNGDFPINRAGFIITTNQPSAQASIGHVVIIGGSTVRGSTGVANTIASILQSCLIENQNFFTVWNAGRDGRYSYTSLRYLIETIIPALNPKIVIQVNGFNDIGHSTISRIEQAEARIGNLHKYEITDKLNGVMNEGGDIMFDIHHSRPYSDINQQRFFHIYNEGYNFSDVISYLRQEFLYLKNFLFMFRLAYKMVEENGESIDFVEVNDRDSLIDEKIVDIAVRDYIAITNATREYLNSVGVRYIHVLQPVPPYEKTLNVKEEGYVLEMDNRKGFELSRHVNSFYEKLNLQIQRDNFRTLNLSALFQDTADTRYVDSSHYNTEANADIARNLCSAILNFSEK